MKLKETENGWVVADMNGTFVLPYTYSRLRTDAIKIFKSTWDEKVCNWEKFKRKGFKCVKAKRTTEIV